MKLRIRGNTIRLRLTKSEVERIGQSLPVEEVTDFGNGQNFFYTIKPSDISENLEASFENGRIEISINKKLAEDWVKNEEVGISGEQKELKILVEKDFNCLKPRNPEEDEDTFPHPQKEMKC